jgi:dipeptidase
MEMCDTVVALGNATADGAAIFAKNSDRYPDEAHQLVLVPRASHQPGSAVRCTHVEIPQVAETHAVLLARPFWIWGAEMGANEHGVVIGNEAVHTRLPLDERPGLIGMDFIRLGLERASTARGALDVMTSLLAIHGQGGNCRHRGVGYYHNSFIIADPREAWVLETAGRHWAAERVRDVRSISNALSIGRTWDLASDGLVDEAVERGWCVDRDEFDFARCYANPDVDCRSGLTRQRRSSEILEAERGGITVATAMRLLRDHGVDPNWQPDSEGISPTICRHGAFEPVRGGQSVGSLVAHLTPVAPVHWLTGTSAPCASVFKPVWLDAGLPDLGPAPTADGDAAALWWRHEAFHRAVVRDFPALRERFWPERDALETRFLSALPSASAPAAERRGYTAQCFAEADQSLVGWTERVRAVPVA